MLTEKKYKDLRCSLISRVYQARWERSCVELLQMEMARHLEEGKTLKEFCETPIHEIVWKKLPEEVKFYTMKED